MYDYELTAGQQQQLVAFFEAGKSIYIEGNDFAYLHSTTGFYKMFGGAYAGDAGTYRGIHSTIWLGAIKDTGASHSEAEIMQAYLNYLRGGNFVVGIKPELSVTTGGTVHLFLENTALDSGRTYAVVGSVTDIEQITSDSGAPFRDGASFLLTKLCRDRNTSFQSAVSFLVVG